MSTVRQRKPKKILKVDEITLQTEAQSTQNRGILKLFLYSSAIIASIIVFAYLYPNSASSHSNSFAKPPKSFEPSPDDVLPSLAKVPAYIPKPPSSTPYTVLGDIPKIKWLPDYEFATQVSSRGLPIVLTNTFVVNWQAIHWTPQYISNQLKDHKFQNVYSHNQPLFGPYWNPDRPMSQIPTIKRHNPWSEIEMTASELIYKILSNSSYEYVYYAGNINTIGSLATELDPIWPLELNPDEEKQNINVWIGQGHTIADTHYDAYENFNVQIYGKKKWTVFPPDSPLYLYPHVHPSNAQCQVVINKPDLNVFPLLSNCKAYEVVMEPGDVLYLPPMWYHHVEALETSISVNVWSFSNQSNLLREFAHMPMGLSYILSKKGGSWLPLNKQAVLKFWLEQLIEKVKGKDSSLMFIRHILDQRFETLYHNGELLRELPNYCGYHCDNRKVIKEVKSLVLSSVEKLGETIKSFPKNVHDIWLGNIAEHVAFMGSEKPDGRHVGAFLYQCFFGGDLTAEE